MIYTYHIQLWPSTLDKRGASSGWPCRQPFQQLVLKGRAALGAVRRGLRSSLRNRVGKPLSDGLEAHLGWMQLVAPPVFVALTGGQCATQIDIAHMREAFVRRDAFDHVVESVDEDADRLFVLILIQKSFLVEPRAKP